MSTNLFSNIYHWLFTLPFGEGRGGAWLLALVFALCGCSKTSDNAELIGIAETVADQPREALERLAAINPDSLPERDAYYHAFLTLKANDKAYIDHTSDSVIVRLLEYYDGSDLYPEVLYYAGRVYSDLGDYPTSLRYFQDALDAVPDDRDNLLLRGAIASQTGRLLNTLRLYDSAIPYLREAIRTNEELADTFNLAYNNQLLGAIYMHRNDLDSAEFFINCAHDFAQNLSKLDAAHMQIYQASIQYEKGNLESALTLIRGVPERVGPLSQNAARIKASNIYYLANDIHDTAYMYAAELIHSADINNLKGGYQNVLSKDLIEFIPADSLVIYVNRYSEELNRFYNLNNAQQSVVQQSMYNYSIHDRERAKAELRNTILIFIIIIIVLFTITTFVIIQYRHKQKLHKLIKTVDDFKSLHIFQVPESDKIKNTPKDVKSLRIYITEQLEQTATINGIDVNIPNSILDSSVYKTLAKYINKEETVKISDKVWTQLESVVTGAYPQMRERLDTLSENPLAPSEYTLLLLIKCGFSSRQIGFLLNKKKSTLTTWRKNLNKALFNESLTATQLNTAIRIL